jgi:hypothetical protein
MRSMCGADAGCLAINHQSLGWGAALTAKGEGFAIDGLRFEAYGLGFGAEVLGVQGFRAF